MVAACKVRESSFLTVGVIPGRGMPPDPGSRLFIKAFFLSKNNLPIF